MKEQPVGGENSTKEVLFNSTHVFFGIEFVSNKEFTSGIVPLARREKAHTSCWSLLIRRLS
jgi:hypothetical protein